MSLRTLLILSALAATAPAAFAQEPEPGLAPAGPPLEMVTDLAEALGEAQAVRSACNGEQDQTWRNYMLTLISYEGPSGPRKSALISAFNRGHRRQLNNTPRCTPDMVNIEAEIARRGRELSEAVARTYLR